MPYGLQIFNTNGTLRLSSDSIGWQYLDHFVVAAQTSGSKSYPQYAGIGREIRAVVTPEYNTVGHVLTVDNVNMIVYWTGIVEGSGFPVPICNSWITVFGR